MNAPTLAETQGSIRLITLDGPQRLNALTPEMLRRMSVAIFTIDKQPFHCFPEGLPANER